MSIELDYFESRYQEAYRAALEVEQKGIRVLNFSTAILVVLTAIGSTFGVRLFSPSDGINWIQLILFALASFCMMCAWGHAMGVSKVQTFPTMPSTKNVADYFTENDNKTNTEFIIECYTDTIERVWAVINTKSKYLEHSQNELVLSAYFAGALAIITIIFEVIK
jgi:hypothetical protein